MVVGVRATAVHAPYSLVPVALANVDSNLSPLCEIYGYLSRSAVALGVRQVVVAISHPDCGQQIFSSDRRLPPWCPVISLEKPAVWTNPAVAIRQDTETAILGVVATALARGLQSGQPQQRPVAAAVARAVRYGWSSALVRMGFVHPVHTPPETRQSLRAGDTAVAVSDRELLLILEAVRDDDIPPILARFARAAGLPAFSFGLVRCPADGVDANDLLIEASHRLAEADRAHRDRDRTIRAASGRTR